MRSTMFTQAARDSKQKYGMLLKTLWSTKQPAWFYRCALLRETDTCLIIRWNGNMLWQTPGGRGLDDKRFLTFCFRIFPYKIEHWHCYSAVRSLVRINSSITVDTSSLWMLKYKSVFEINIHSSNMWDMFILKSALQKWEKVRNLHNMKEMSIASSFLCYC